MAGPKPYLSSTEEKELADFLVDVAKVGYGRTRKQVRTIAGSCAHNKGRLESPVVASHYLLLLLLLSALQ